MFEKDISTNLSLKQGYIHTTVNSLIKHQLLTVIPVAAAWNNCCNTLLYSNYLVIQLNFCAGWKTTTCGYLGDGKTPHKMSSQEKTPQEKTPQKSPVEKTPHPILGLVEKTPHPIFRLVEKTSQLYKKNLSFLFNPIFLTCTQDLSLPPPPPPPLYSIFRPVD